MTSGEIGMLGLICGQLMVNVAIKCYDEMNSEMWGGLGLHRDI